MAKGKRRIADEARKTEMIVLRVTQAEKGRLAQEAKGKCTVSELVHSKLFSGGLRSHDTLRQIAALHDVGMSLRSLAAEPSAPPLQLDALLTLTRASILKLSGDLP
jgi:hypothetical protein